MVQFRVCGVRYRDRELQSLWRRLQVAVPLLFENVKIEPSLLHGDFHPLNAGKPHTRTGRTNNSTAPTLFPTQNFFFARLVRGEIGQVAAADVRSGVLLRALGDGFGAGLR